MLALVLIGSLLFADVGQNESPETREPRRAAFALIRQGKFDAALPELRIAADKGDRLALYQLGVLYEVGKAVPQNYRLAWECFAKSADRGLLAANHKLGIFYYYGWHVEKSEKKAVERWLAGAKKGFAPSQYLWATTTLCLHKSDTSSDNTQAIHWLLKSARQNLPEAVCLLGVMYEVGFGVKKDLALARALEERSLEGKFEVEPNMKASAKMVLDRVNKKASAAVRVDS